MSGGVDSMALAYLCKGLEEREEFRFKALVVDHQAREESAVEALHVASRLKAMGIYKA